MNIVIIWIKNAFSLAPSKTDVMVLVVLVAHTDVVENTMIVIHTTGGTLTPFLFWYLLR